MAQFKPVRLTKDGKTREVRTADEETSLRFRGWRSAPKPAPRPAQPKPESK